ncbi:hypothetical protein AC1031_001488 [Aphanomyces cochlioides]|nr:hypothetical protein AC1031_001488 [Aphanomyces cochlioides]
MARRRKKLSNGQQRDENTQDSLTPGFSARELRSLIIWLVVAVIALAMLLGSMIALFLSWPSSNTRPDSTPSQHIRLLRDVDQLPIPKFRALLCSVVTTFEHDGIHGLVHAAMYYRDGFDASLKYKPLPKGLFASNVVYGMFSITAWDLLQLNETKIEPRKIAWLEDTYTAMRSATGFLFVFPKTSPTIEHQVILQARIREQAQVFKWSMHTWGEQSPRHSNIIQEILPTFAQLEALRSQSPSYHIEDDHK